MCFNYNTNLSMISTHSRNNGDFVVRRLYFTMAIFNASIIQKESRPITLVAFGMGCTQVAVTYCIFAVKGGSL